MPSNRQTTAVDGSLNHGIKTDHRGKSTGCSRPDASVVPPGSPSWMEGAQARLEASRQMFAVPGGVAIPTRTTTAGRLVPRCPRGRPRPGHTCTATSTNGELSGKLLGRLIMLLSFSEFRLTSEEATGRSRMTACLPACPQRFQLPRRAATA